MAKQLVPRHIFVDHSNMWGGARLASRILSPDQPDMSARVKIRELDTVLGGRRQGTSTKIVSGGIPPGMEGVWAEYERCGYDTQRLFRDEHWKERGVDHSIIGHMWRLLAKAREAPTHLVLASGDGKINEFGTSFYEVIKDVLTRQEYGAWSVTLASFHWPDSTHNVRSPTNSRMRRLVEESSRGEFVNLHDFFDRVVFHRAWEERPGA